MSSCKTSLKSIQENSTFKRHLFQGGLPDDYSFTFDSTEPSYSERVKTRLNNNRLAEVPGMPA
jgi:hypothetical protein